jgi:hypothetical protein
MSKFKAYVIIWVIMFISCCALIVYMIILINKSLDAAQYNCPKGTTKIIISNGWGCQIEAKPNGR